MDEETEALILAAIAYGEKLLETYQFLLDEESSIKAAVKSCSDYDKLQKIAQNLSRARVRFQRFIWLARDCLDWLVGDCLERDKFPVESKKLTEISRNMDRRFISVRTLEDATNRMARTLRNYKRVRTTSAL